MRRRLTAPVVARVQALARNGVPRDGIAAELKLSVRSVGNALASKRPAPKAPARPAAAPGNRNVDVPDGAQVGAPSMSEQLEWLGQTIRLRRADADAARLAGDVVEMQRATRDVLQASAMLARHSAPTAPDGIFCSLPAMQAAAADARARMLARAERSAAAAATAPKCPTCGQPRLTEGTEA